MGFPYNIARVEYSINSRPLALAPVSNTSQQDEMLQPLTPNQLLLGRNTTEVPPMEYDLNNKFSARVAYVQSVHTEWWSKWVDEVLPILIPRKRWRKSSRNLKKNDVVLISYKGNLVDDYRLGIITEVFPDSNGRVRTVEVSFRKRDKREPLRECRSKPLTWEKVGIQRLSLISSADEAPSSDLGQTSD